MNDIKQKNIPTYADIISGVVEDDATPSTAYFINFLKLNFDVPALLFGA